MNAGPGRRFARHNIHSLYFSARPPRGLHSGRRKPTHGDWQEKPVTKARYLKAAATRRTGRSNLRRPGGGIGLQHIFGHHSTTARGRQADGPGQISLPTQAILADCAIAEGDGVSGAELSIVSCVAMPCLQQAILGSSFVLDISGIFDARRNRCGRRCGNGRSQVKVSAAKRRFIAAA